MHGDDELRAVLGRRRARARAAMRAHLSTLAGAPRNPLALFHPIGGYRLAPELLAACRRSAPALCSALRESGVACRSHSFAGDYLFAEPELYVSPPAWESRRRRLDERIRGLHGALPQRLPRQRLDFATWTTLLLTLDVLRTDLCSVLWNELAIASAGAGRTDVVPRCEQALRGCVQATLEILPRIDAAADDRRPEAWPADLVLGERIVPPPALHSSPPDLPADAVRALRASDDTFSVWASLFVLATGGETVPAPCWALGNGFGGLDLGFFAAEALAAMGVESAPGICRAGGHRKAPAADPVRWPTGPEPRTILFCDDSVSSGGTFAQFREICHARHPAVVVDSFVLTFDLAAARGDEHEVRERFARARHATARAPWSPSPHPRPAAAPGDVPQLLAMLRGRSDERLRWLGGAGAPIVRALNEPRR